MKWTEENLVSMWNSMTISEIEDHLNTSIGEILVEAYYAGIIPEDKIEELFEEEQYELDL